MFTTFTRLTNHEGPPRTEELATVPWWSPRRYRLRLRGRPALVLSLAVALVVSAVFLGISQTPLNCAAQVSVRGPVTQAHARACPALPAVKGLGHGP